MKSKVKARSWSWQEVHNRDMSKKEQTEEA